jgi:hypothetical protein
MEAVDIKRKNKNGAHAVGLKRPRTVRDAVVRFAAHPGG